MLIPFRGRQIPGELGEAYRIVRGFQWVGCREIRRGLLLRYTASGSGCERRENFPPSVFVESDLN